VVLRSLEEVEEYQENWQLQLSQSAAESYFIQLESDRWALRVPEDPVDLISFRWPIGFVTSGAVHAWYTHIFKINLLRILIKPCSCTSFVESCTLSSWYD
jgi:hypothetical protein